MKVLPPAIGSFSLNRGLFFEALHLKELSQVETKDLPGNLSGYIIMNIPLLKSSIHKGITPTKYSSPKGYLRNWRVPSSSFGNFFYISYYWEWVEDVLLFTRKTWKHQGFWCCTYISSYIYNYDNMLHAFCELWYLCTNTVLTFIGEMPISAWDLQAIGRLPIFMGPFMMKLFPL